jgi:hypothetical protein
MDRSISYLISHKSSEEMCTGSCTHRVAILRGRITVKYVKVLNYLKIAFIDSVKLEKALDKLTHITQHSNINTYIQEFNTLHRQMLLLSPS